ncbi:D-alanyl-D-alanine carboxypeptidase/D-alanyl-D-alanine-endopeptidase [Arcticibacter sp.]|uniref:D-alanyl-D-alanine carboxypeptidase/D-alanyl-D-alanine endopeptidase n=1 Tax=Arcticibacter sp. TaxID=1872630 RepID=UPI00388F62EB
MKSCFLPLLLLVSQIVAGQTLKEKISEAYLRYERDSQLQYGLSSLTVLHAETGEVIFSKNGSTGLAPASTLKTITSITGYSLLKPGYQWETSLGYNGTLSGGVLSGDLIIKGNGDPSLGSSRYQETQPAILLARWLDAAKKAGINKINGDIIADDLLFGTQTLSDGWTWGDMGNYYGAGSTAMTWRENEIGVNFTPGSRSGATTTLRSTDPQVPGVRIVNEVITGHPGSGDHVYAYSAPFGDIIYLRGTYGIDLKKQIKISMPDPALFLAQELRAQLSKAGIPVTGTVTTARKLALDQKSPKALSAIIDRYQSPDISRIVYWLNQKSLNLYTENLLRTASIASGRTGSFDDATKTLASYWDKKLGIDKNAISILDGSGLSPENRVTTLAMATILYSARSEEWFPQFYESLPLYNNMKMKSGSIRRVLAYTGYHKSAAGIPLVFSFITNNYSGGSSAIRQKMFKMLDTLK